MNRCRLCKEPLPPFPARQGIKNYYHETCRTELAALLLNTSGRDREEIILAEQERRLKKVAIKRTCIRVGCNTEFIARHEAALYCGLDCYALDNHHTKLCQDRRRAHEQPPVDRPTPRVLAVG